MEVEQAMVQENPWHKHWNSISAKIGANYIKKQKSNTCKRKTKKNHYQADKIRSKNEKPWVEKWHFSK